jgi:hypothetical protein
MLLMPTDDALTVTQPGRHWEWSRCWEKLTSATREDVAWRPPQRAPRMRQSRSYHVSKVCTNNASECGLPDRSLAGSVPRNRAAENLHRNAARWMCCDDTLARALAVPCCIVEQASRLCELNVSPSFCVAPALEDAQETCPLRMPESGDDRCWRRFEVVK